MGKWKALIPVVLALGVALIGSLFLFKLINGNSRAENVVRVETPAVSVAVAAVDLAAGTKLEPMMVAKARFLEESLPPGHITDESMATGRILIAAVKKNEPITEHRLAPQSVKAGGISVLVEPGKRAVAVKGDKVIGISGLIQPGNRVDVLVTLTDPRTKQEVTKIVLENVLVLATGPHLEGKADKGETAPVDVYTLQVSPEEGEKLALAATQGKLLLALRNATDGETVLTKGATISETLASYRHAAEAKVPESPTQVRVPRTVTVEVIKGDKVNKVRF